VLSVVLSSLLILLLVGTLVVVFFTWSRQKAKQEMQMVHTKLDFEKELRQVESEVHDRVMTRFAQELHDNIGQLLTSMHVHIENQKIDHPHMELSFKPVEIYLREVTQGVKLLSRTLNNDSIVSHGLWQSIKNEAIRLNTLKRFTVHDPVLNGKPFLTAEHVLMIFRIFQEITQNALKHSKAKNLYISGQADETIFLLRVEDDGKGFDTMQTLNSSKASGLKNIIRRAELSDIACTIQSSPGNGCKIELKKQQKPI
jgi:signal transduction histidine kinase